MTEKECFISALPGIGVQTARKLLDHFGSIKKLIPASREELLSLEGIGEKTADRLSKLFEERYLLKEEKS